MRVVFEAEQHCASQWEVICSVAVKLGPTSETVRKWVSRIEVDQSRRDGVTSDERERLEVLECENRELRRVKEVLVRAASFFRRARRPSAVIAYIDAPPGSSRAEPIGKALQFAPSTYWSAKRHPASTRSLRDEVLKKVEIARVFAENYGLRGAQDIWAQLDREGHLVGVGHGSGA